MNSNQEHEFEAAPGLPEALPQGEHILWQGRPDAHALAMQVYHVQQFAAYFVVMLMLQALFLSGDSGGFAFKPLLLSSTLAMVAIGLLYAVGTFAARNTLYTFTNKRVVMRIGIVLTFTLNLPYRQISTAGVRNPSGGKGDIALDLAGEDRIGWLHLWPHARPWHLNKPQPSLRCIPNVNEVAEVLQSAWCAANLTALARLGDVSAPVSVDVLEGRSRGAIAT